MTFLLFVLSAVVMEAILAYDQRRERAGKASHSAAGAAARPSEELAPDPADGLLPLFKALNQYGQGAAAHVLEGWQREAGREASAVPYWDATVTAFSLVAQWLLAQKVLENWLIWIAVDVLYVGIFVFRQLYPSAVLYGIFLFLATQGYLEWKKSLASPAPA